MIYRETDAWQRFAAAALDGIVSRLGGDPMKCAKAAANYADALWQEMHDRESKTAERNAQGEGKDR